MRTPRRLATALVAALLLALPAAPATGLLSSKNLLTTAEVDQQIADASGDTSALLHLADGVLVTTVIDTVDALGLQAGSYFEALHILHVTGDAALIRSLAVGGLVDRIEYDAPLQYFTDSSHEATRGQEVLDGTAAELGGASYDGSGVGVAVVDSGVMDSHPDLSDAVVSNVKVVPLTNVAVPLTDSDVISLGGHGTHVAGIVAGDGSASSGQFHGAAPGSAIYSVSAGTFISVHSALEALEWVLDNHDQVSPRIRVVNNSWGSAGDGTYNPGNALSQMIRALIGDGVVVVWAAGNDGGNGTNATTSPTCVEPTPGNICVAAYDDNDNGTRNGSIAGFSSRGRDGEPSTYPDLAAPGDSIVAACAPVMPICATGVYDLWYSNLSGTSMAAPHIAGIVAQMLQANPNLTPAQVEDILEDTATAVPGSGPLIADPTNPTTPTAFDAGHGLVDVVAAIVEARQR
jgi:serine protease AprX